MYDVKGNIVAMSQVFENLPPPLSQWTSQRQSQVDTMYPRRTCNWQQQVRELCGVEQSEKGSNEEGNHPTEERVTSDDERDEELIPNSGL